MATFKLVDELNAPLISTETPSASGLAKYLPAPVLEIMALRPAAKALAQAAGRRADEPCRRRVLVAQGACPLPAPGR